MKKSLYFFFSIIFSYTYFYVQYWQVKSSPGAIGPGTAPKAVEGPDGPSIALDGPQHVFFDKGVFGNFIVITEEFFNVKNILSKKLQL